MTARFDRITMIDVADSRANKVSWKAIGEELNLTATELKAIRKDRSYRMVAAEVMVATDADVSVFGVEKHMEGVVELHASEMKAEAEAKVEETVEVETTTDTTDEVAETATSTTEETTEMTKPAPTTEDLEARLERCKALYTEKFGLDLEGNEVIATAEAETPEVSTSAQLKTEKDEAYKAYQTALNAFETSSDYETTLERKKAKDRAFGVYNEALTAYEASV